MTLTNIPVFLFHVLTFQDQSLSKNNISIGPVPCSISRWCMSGALRIRTRLSVSKTLLFQLQWGPFLYIHCTSKGEDGGFCSKGTWCPVPVTRAGNICWTQHILVFFEHKGGFITRGTGCTITLFQHALSNTFCINKNNHKTNEVKNNAAIGVYRDRNGRRGSSWNPVLRSDGCSRNQ